MAEIIGQKGFEKFDGTSYLCISVFKTELKN